MACSKAPGCHTSPEAACCRAHPTRWRRMQAGVVSAAAQSLEEPGMEPPTWNLQRQAGEEGNPRCGNKKRGRGKENEAVTVIAECYAAIDMRVMPVVGDAADRAGRGVGIGRSLPRNVCDLSPLPTDKSRASRSRGLSLKRPILSSLSQCPARPYNERTSSDTTRNVLDKSMRCRLGGPMCTRGKGGACSISIRR